MKRKRQGRECPYMDTIDRTVLDFDYEKVIVESMGCLDRYLTNKNTI